MSNREVRESFTEDAVLEMGLKDMKDGGRGHFQKDGITQQGHTMRLGTMYLAGALGDIGQTSSIQVPSDTKPVAH